MPLKNYTTTISAARTVGEVQQMLSTAGAVRITIDYQQRQPAGVEFEINTSHGPRSFALPVRISAVLRVLTAEWNSRHSRGKRPDADQAARVGWRIVRDWLAAQLALIQVGMVQLDEVMLPYMLTIKGETVYQRYERQALALPAEGDTHAVPVV